MDKNIILGLFVFISLVACAISVQAVSSESSTYKIDCTPEVSTLQSFGFHQFCSYKLKVGSYTGDVAFCFDTTIRDAKVLYNKNIDVTNLFQYKFYNMVKGNCYYIEDASWSTGETKSLDIYYRPNDLSASPKWDTYFGDIGTSRIDLKLDPLFNNYLYEVGSNRSSDYTWKKDANIPSSISFVNSVSWMFVGNTSINGNISFRTGQVSSNDAPLHIYLNITEYYSDGTSYTATIYDGTPGLNVWINWSQAEPNPTKTIIYEEFYAKLLSASGTGTFQNTLNNYFALGSDVNSSSCSLDYLNVTTSYSLSPASFNYNFFSHYSFNETSGNISDSISNYNLTQVGTVPSQVGQINNSRGVYGTTQYFKGSTGFSVNDTRSFTISAWEYLTSVTTGFDDILELSTNEAAGSFQVLLWHRGSNVINFQTSLLNGADGCIAASTSPLPSNTWVMVTGVYNGSTKNCSLYINGVPNSSAINTNSGGTASTTLSIGINNPVTNPSGQATKLYIDEIYLVNTSLSASAISTMYNSSATGYPYSIISGSNNCSLTSNPIPLVYPFKGFNITFNAIGNYSINISFDNGTHYNYYNGSIGNTAWLYSSNVLKYILYLNSLVTRINNVSIGFNSTFSTVNVSIFDASTYAIITQNITLAISGMSYFNSSYLTNSGNIIINNLPVENNVEFRLSGVNYSTSKYYLNITNGSSQILNAYLNPITVSQNLSLCFYDTNGVVISNLLVFENVLSAGGYVLSQSLFTDISGRVFFTFNPTNYYRYNWSSTVYAQTFFNLNPPLNSQTLADGCNYDIILISASTTPTYSVVQVIGNASFNNVTRIITLSYTSLNSSYSNYYLNVFKTVNGVNVLICNNSNTAMSGFINCNVTGYVGQVFVRGTADGSIFYGNWIDLGNTSSFASVLNVMDAALICGLIVLVVACGGLAFGVFGAGVSGVIGLLAIFWLGMFTPVTATVVIIDVVITIVILVSLKPRGL